MKKDVISNLEKINLSENEAKVYVALAEIGQTSAGKLIADTRLHRSVVYETLDKLIERKLVFQIKKKKIAYYAITNPERILDNLKYQTTIAEGLIKELKNIAKIGKSEIVVYEGVDAYRRFWLERAVNLPKESTMYISNSIGERWIDIFGSQAKTFVRKMTERKIHWKMIIFQKVKLEEEISKKNPELFEYRYIDKVTDNLGNFNLFNDDVLVLNSTTEPMVIEVKNKTLVKVFRDIFEILWQLGKKM